MEIQHQTVFLAFGGFAMRTFKRILGLSLLTLGLFTMGAGMGAAQSQEVAIDGDHGKLSAVIQRPAGKTEYPFGHHHAWFYGQ